MKAIEEGEEGGERPVIETPSRNGEAVPAEYADEYRS
jgi:hypothetical protein